MSGLLPIVPKDTAVASEPAARAEDPVAELRALHAHVLEQKTEDFPVPGYGGRLVVRYKVLDPGRYEEIIDAPGETKEQRHAQFLIEACDEILWRYQDGEVGRLPQGKVTLAVEVGETVETLDQVLGLPPQNDVRDTVLGLFGGKWGALNSHAVSVDRWMRTLFDQADEAVVGGQ